MPDTYKRTTIIMDTLVAIQVVRPKSTTECAKATERALEWFQRVEESCSRFNENSEVFALATQVGKPVAVSPLLYEAVNFAVAVARSSDGAFDPAVGKLLESRGFNRDYQTGRTMVSSVALDVKTSYRDVRLDPDRRTITLLRPVVLDLGAVAKGFAIDLAARELSSFSDFTIDAGGDLYVRGRNLTGKPWRIGIRNPRPHSELIDTVSISDHAVCTSGDYERPSTDASGGHHLVDLRTRRSPSGVASVTVVAPTAMAADALGTAAFVLGPTRGIHFLEQQGVDGLIVSPALERYQTRGFSRYRA